jgi:Mn-dependent DtxR family transcriptional regulator
VFGMMPKQAISNLSEELLKTMFNLKKRQTVEYERLSKSLQVDNEKTLNLIKKLESAILELDNTIMLFNEY